MRVSLNSLKAFFSICKPRVTQTEAVPKLLAEEDHMTENWIPIIGAVDISENGAIAFKGGQQSSPEGSVNYNFALVMNSASFGGGTISADITFLSPVTSESTAGVILYRHPENDAFTVAQLGGTDLCSVWTFFSGGAQPKASPWTRHGGAGQGTTLTPNRTYTLHVDVAGSNVAMTLDGVKVSNITLPYSLPRGNTGLWYRGPTDVKISNFTVNKITPKVFVVMQFTPPYNDLFHDVIEPVCTSLNLDAQRADDIYGPGVIIKDIERQILETRIVVADITPQNLNVYYEVGYAHALKKDTILIAEKPADLPFDVSPFRVLLYENTIAGKAKVEIGLRKHLEAIIGRP